MAETYLEQLIQERKENRKASRAWLQCFICQTPPTFEQCKAHFAKQGMKVQKDDYEAVCEKMNKTPQYGDN